MGEKFEYYVSHASTESFDIQKYLDILNCHSKKQSVTAFKMYNGTIIRSTNTSPKFKKAKLIAKIFEDTGYEILRSIKFENYWKNRDSQTALAKLRANEARMNRRQTESYSRLLDAADQEDLIEGNNEQANSMDMDEYQNQKSSNTNDLIEENNQRPNDTINDIIIIDSQDSKSYASTKSKESVDPEPIKEDVKPYYVTTEGDYSFDLNENSKRWILARSKTDISSNFIQFRRESLIKAEDMEDLEKHEELSLHGVMLIDDDICAERYLDLQHVEELLDEIQQLQYFSCAELTKAEQEICDVVAAGLAKRKVNYSDLSQVLDEWKKKQDTPEARQLQRYLENVIDTYSMNYSSTKANEATLVRDTLDGALRAYFKNSPLLQCLGADNMIDSSSERFTTLDPSLQNHGKRADFSVISERCRYLLLSLEAKRIGSSISGDFMKLVREMKDSLKKINKGGYINVQVCGLLMKGSRVEVFVMDHLYDGLYRMVLVTKISLPVDRYEVFLVKSIAAIIRKLYGIISDCARIVNSKSRNQVLPANSPSIHSPIKADRPRKLNLAQNSRQVKKARKKL